jgi:hypothetical protein
MKTKIYFLTAFLVFLFTLPSAYAQSTAADEGEISGKILDEVQKEFPYATVSLLNSKDSTIVRGTLTADNGNFQFKDIKPGDYLISVYVVGYKKTFKGPFAITSSSKKHSLDRVQLATDAQMLKGSILLNKSR